MEHKEEKIGGELIYQGSIIRVEKHTVRMEDGSTALREMVYHPGGVNVVALTPDNQVYMVRQYRYPFGRMLLETPAGNFLRERIRRFAAAGNWKKKRAWWRKSSLFRGILPYRRVRHRSDLPLSSHQPYRHPPAPGSG